MWRDRTLRSGIEQLQNFARDLQARLPGILAYCHRPLRTSRLEGINNKIMALKRVAHDLHDDDCSSSLKTRQAFPGISR